MANGKRDEDVCYSYTYNSKKYNHKNGRCRDEREEKDVPWIVAD